MDADTLEKINAQVYRKFPEVSKSRPKVLPQGETDHVLITYRGTVTTADGKQMSRVVRVVANAKGQIIKMTTSH